MKAAPAVWLVVLAAIGLEAAWVQHSLAPHSINVAAAGEPSVNAPLATRAQRADPASSAPTAPGQFHLSDEQLRFLTVQTVARIPFHSEIVTDGQIAYDADALTPVYSPYSGRVVRLIAALGARVRQGGALFTLDAVEYGQAASDLATASAQVHLNTAIERRKRAQYQAHAISLQEWQRAQSDLVLSRAALTAVVNRLRSFGETDSQIAALEAAGVSADAPITVAAPVRGVVVDRQIGPGQYLTAGSAAVYTVADLSHVWLVADVPESEAGAVRLGQRVSAEVSGLPGRQFVSTISYVAAAVDPTTRRMRVHAVLANPDDALKPQMFATLTITTSPVAPALAVPAAAVIHEGEAARVWTLDGHDARLAPVRVGRSLQGMVEVLAGLQPGDKVITHGALFVDRAAGGE